MVPPGVVIVSPLRFFVFFAGLFVKILPATAKKLRMSAPGGEAGAGLVSGVGLEGSARENESRERERVLWHVACGAAWGRGPARLTARAPSGVRGPGRLMSPAPQLWRLTSALHWRVSPGTICGAAREAAERSPC